MYGQSAYSQDMSGWSDKTVCRLVNGKGNIQAYFLEADKRQLDCATNVTTKTKKKEDESVAYRNFDFKSIVAAMKNDSLGELRIIDPSSLTSQTAKSPMSVIQESVIGETSIAFKLENGDCGGDYKWSDCDNNRERVEINFGKENAKQEKWYRYYIKFPRAHSQLAPASLSVIQWKRYSKPSRTMVMIQHTAAGLTFNRNGDTFPDSHIVLVREDDLYDRWIEIVYNTNWHPDEAKGYMKVWVDGELKVDFAGIAHSPKAETLYMKVGLYSSHLQLYSKLFPGESFPTREMFIDGIRMDGTCIKLLKNKDRCVTLKNQTIEKYLIHKKSKYSTKASSWDLYPVSAKHFK